MRAREYELMLDAIEVGVNHGWRAAHKHVEGTPSEAYFKEAMEREIMNAISERFIFDGVFRKDNDV